MGSGAFGSVYKCFVDNDEKTEVAGMQYTLFIGVGYLNMIVLPFSENATIAEKYSRQMCSLRYSSLLFSIPSSLFFVVYIKF